METAVNLNPELRKETISRVGFDTFRADVLSMLDTPFDDLIKIAQDACEKAETSHCIGPLTNT